MTPYATTDFGSAMTITINQIAGNANLWFEGVWPYILGIMLLILLMLVLVFSAISAFVMLAGRRVPGFEAFDADYVSRGSPVDGKKTHMTLEEFERDYERRGSPVS